MDLKKKKPSLKTFISVGGWAIGGEPFSDMVRFRGLRKSFIDSAISFMDDRGFDGIDIDWEYPTAEDRGKKLIWFDFEGLEKQILTLGFVRWS
jgi:chitinase